MASPPPPPTPMAPHAADPDDVRSARIRALRAAAPGLPLATTGARGEPLRWRVREEEGEARLALLVAWRDALDTLHAAGLGTDGALAATLILRGGQVAFDPDRIWPLGARPPSRDRLGADAAGGADGAWPIARPVAAWLDVHEIRGWLDAAGHEGPHPFPEGDTPFAGASLDDTAEGGVRLALGPVAETLAIAAALGLNAVAARSVGRVDTDAAALVARALAGAGTILLAAEDADPERLPRWLIAATRTELSCSGGAPPIQDDDARLLGLPPTSPDAEDPASGTPTDEVRRRLEETDLVADSTARHRARAALTAKVVHPDLDAARRNREAAVTLARTAGDRLVLADALLARAMGDDVVDAGAALKDATEARRIAAASGARTRVALGAAVEQLLARLEGGRPPVLDGNPNASPGSDERAFGKPTGAEIALEAVRRWAAGPLGGAARVLNLAGLTGQEAVIAMVAELATWRAIGEGRELRQERLLGAVVAARRRRPAPAGAADTTRMATALAALLAARRGAELTASDHLVALGDAPRLSPRVGAIAAIAARSVNMDALAARLGHAAGDTSTPARLLAWAPPVGDPEPGVLALFGELLVGRSEAEIRRHLPLLEGKVAAWLDAPREADAPVGLLVAVGTALATVGERRAEAPLRRALAAGELEEVVELRALGALAWTLPDGSDDARAVAARLAARTALRPAAIGAERARPAPPISAREATARMVEAVEGWSGALRRSTPDGGPMAAIESLLGPASPAAARRGLRALTMPLEVREEVGGGVTLTVGAGRADAVELRFQGPLALPPDIAERLLAALAPLTTSGREADAIDEAPDPGLALDAALIAGDIDFMRDVRARFARHELTRETVRSALRQALSRTGGLYTAVAEGWGIRDYQRFMDFLRRNGCLEDFRPFRRGPAGGDPARRHGGRTQRLAERRGH